MFSNGHEANTGGHGRGRLRQAAADSGTRPSIRENIRHTTAAPSVCATAGRALARQVVQCSGYQYQSQQ